MLETLAVPQGRNLAAPQKRRFLILIIGKTDILSRVKSTFYMRHFMPVIGRRFPCYRTAISLGLELAAVPIVLPAIALVPEPVQLS